VVQHVSDRIAVMYLGRVVEVGTTEGIFYDARHPYTQALISSTPIPDPQARRSRVILQGSVPSPLNPPPGCSFHPRCAQALPLCATEEPRLVDVGDGHLVACHRAG
jgi:oligopeptide/dipeptide ABC transporter ATP-binding protein